MFSFGVFVLSVSLLVALLKAELPQTQNAPHVSASEPGIPDTELNALHALYNSTDGDNWTWPRINIGPNKGLPWNFSDNANPCTPPGWYGIDCTVTFPQSVSNITLTNLNLTGTLPVALENFPALRSLELRDNPKLVGPIPDVFGSLTKLRQIFLARNGLTGPMPASIGQAFSLETVILYENALSNTLPATLCNLRVLRGINFASNYLNGTIPNCFNQLVELTALNISRNLFTGTIPAWLDSWNNISTIDFLSNRLVGTIPESIGKLANLSHLGLGSNSLSGPLPLVFCNLMTLNGLSISDSGLSGPLPNCMFQINSLATFEADYNRFSGTLPHNILSMPRLRYFSCRNNLIHGTIPHLFGSALHLIALAGNHFTGHFPDELFTLPLLTALNISDNYLTGTFPTANYTTTLLSFDVGANYFSGTLPASLGENTLLQYLLINDNLLHGSLPTTLQRLGQLQELNVQYNFLSGPINFINVSSHAYLYTILLSDNQLTGQIPDDIYVLHNLKVFSAVSNCFYSQLTDSMCVSRSLVTLALDGMRSGRSCRSVLLGQTGAYYVQHALVQQIPDCLFRMKSLTTLHLSGNGLTGKLPGNITISPALLDLSLSHNQLSGTIPDNFQTKGWASLDLSYNRYTGSLHTEFGYNRSDSDASGKMALENNRLSGVIPRALLEAQQIRILGSNIFGCTDERNELPQNDPGRSTYHCGSNSFELPYYCWLALSVLCVAVLLWALYYTGSNEQCLQLTLFVQKAQVLLSHVHAISLGGSARYVRSVLLLCDNIGMLSAACVLLTVVVLVPLYLAMAEPYGTYSHQYAWQISAALLSGRTVAAVMMVLWLLLLCTVLALSHYFQRREKAFKEEQKRARPESRTISLSVAVLSWFERCMLYGMFTLISVCVVVGVNILYVLVVLYKRRRVVLLVQILLAFFKLFWSNFCSRELMHWTARQISKSIETTESVYGREFHLVQLLVSLLNNIAIPCVVVAVVSPNCFYNVFVDPPTVRASYVYSKCAYNSIVLGQCQAYENATGTTSYNPPFVYNYECSSSIITYYAPAFVFLCITATFVTPASQYLFSHATRIPGLPARVKYAFDYFVPKIMKPFDPTVTPVFKLRSPYFDANRAVILLFSYLGMLLTFGVVFPPLAAALAITILSTTYFIKVTMGSFIARAVELKAEEYIRQLNLACERMAQLSVLGPSVWLIVTCSCFFYTLFLFDTLGNAVGLSEAY